ncbi:unnamed protein product, partial [Rotaria sordida]
MENLNPRVIAIKYAIRGPIAIRAAEIDQQLKKGGHNFPFDHLIRANAGDCHASYNQVPITYIRQMTPIPQFPLYSATLSEYGAYEIEYYLDEDNNWALNTEELERALNKEKDNCVPRCIVVINPGNPT